MSEKCVLLDSSIKSLVMILFITSLGTIIHKKLSVRLLNHTNTLSQLTIRVCLDKGTTKNKLGLNNLKFTIHYPKMTYFRVMRYVL